ncbi:MAG: peptidylprolyl isomerase, partial [Terriglobales bacterium]
VLKFVRLQTLAQLLARNVREEAATVPQPEVQKYYDEHKDQFTQATLQRIFIPKSAPNEKDKPNEATLKAEADKIEAAAKTPSADFNLLQKQAYDDLKIPSSPPTVELQDMRRDSLPPGQQQAVFNLAPGAVSEPIDEPAAIYIYKLVSKDVQPLAQVEAEIKRNLEQQRFQADMEKIVAGTKPELNQAYFGASETGRPEAPRVTVTPGSSPASKTPTSAPKSSSNPPKPK